jgi:hypothetical protein
MGRSGAFVRAAGVLTACILAASLIGAAAAGARTAGFHVYNLTAKSMKLKEIQLLNDAEFARDEDGGGAPKVGDVLAPGVDTGRKYDHNHIELERPLNNYRIARLFYAADGRDYGAWLSARYHETQCEWFSPEPYCKEDGDSIYFLEEPGTVREFPASDPQKHAEFVRQLCTNSNMKTKFVKCDFDPTAHDDDAFGSPHVVGVTVPNCAPETGVHATDEANAIEVELEEGDKTGTENSYGLKIGIEAEFDYLGAKVKTTLEEEYEHSWTSEYSFKKKLSYKVLPGHIGWVVAENPVIRVTGDMTLKIGNTTLILRDVYYDYPDPTREGEVQWKPVRPEMTAEQKKQECKEESGSGVKAPASHAAITRKGTRGSNTMYGGRESTTLLGRGGNDILIGASGHDTLIGGPGRDTLEGGDGSDTIVDSRGRTEVSTGDAGHEGVDSVDVRDGKGDDRVTCGDSSATVKADPGDRVRGCGG